MSVYRSQTARRERLQQRCSGIFSRISIRDRLLPRLLSAGARAPSFHEFDARPGARVVRLARFHRVQALVWNAIAALPDSPRSAFESLAADATEIAGANLRATAACAGLLAAFEQAGLRLLFLKGLPLGMLAYGSATLKSAVDIDLLVAPGELGEAAALIEGQGYRLVIPKARPGGGALRRWHRIRKEFPVGAPALDGAARSSHGVAGQPSTDPVDRLVLANAPRRCRQWHVAARRWRRRETVRLSRGARRIERRGSA